MLHEGCKEVGPSENRLADWPFLLPLRPCEPISKMAILVDCLETQTHRCHVVELMLLLMLLLLLWICSRSQPHKMELLEHPRVLYTNYSSLDSRIMVGGCNGHDKVWAPVMRSMRIANFPSLGKR